MTAHPEATVTLTLSVNGDSVEVTAAPETPLLYVLRNDLGLKGTRFGCGLGQCGACMVILDGRARPSCNLAISDVGDRPVTTIEALARDGRLHPVQQAIVDEGAGQCGYCIPGIIIAAVALLDAVPSADDREVRQALDRNICRCGVHARVLRALRRIGAAGVGERDGPG